MRFFATLCAAVSLSGLMQGQTPLPVSLASMSFPPVASPVIYGLGGDSSHPRYPVKSSDNGQSWVPLYVFEAGTVQNVTGIAVDPSNPNTVYVSAQMNRGGVWKSADGGATWTAKNKGLPGGSPDSVENLTVAVNAPQVLYVRVGNRLYKSIDGAENWTEHADVPSLARRGRLELQPVSPTRGYIIARGAGALQSTDDGKTWTFRGEMTVQNGSVEENAYAQCITIDPTNFNVVFACIDVDAFRGLIGIWGFWRSADGGATWTNVYETPQAPAARNVIIDPRGGTVHLNIGFFSRTYARSTNGGLNFTDMGGSFSPLAVDPRNPNLLWGSNGFHLSRDAGLTFEASNATFRPTFLRAAEPVNMQLEEGQTAQNLIPVATAEALINAVSFTASVSGAPWLTIPPQNATTSTSLRVNVSTIGLAPGMYEGSITVTSPQTMGPGAIPVRLTVNPQITGATYGLGVFAGGGANTGENVPAVGAQITLLRQLAADNQGRVYYATAARVRVVENGRVRTFAGTGEFTGTNNPNGDGGPATQATFRVSADGVAAAPDGRVFISDGLANSVRVVQGGIIQTYVPSTMRVNNSSFFSPKGLSLAPNGDLYIASSNGISRRPANEDRLELIISPPLNAQFADVKVTADGTIYFSDRGRHRVYRIRPGRANEPVAGTGVRGFNGDGLATQAQLDTPIGIDVDAEGNVWIADSGNKRIRVLGTDGVLRTVAGGGTNLGVVDIAGTEADLSLLDDVLVTPQGVPLFTALGTIYRLTKDTLPRPRTVQSQFRNAGSYTEKLSPGSLFSFFGKNMAASEAVASGSPWPTTLGGATVFINNVAVPLFYASPTQINGQVPYNLNIGQTYFAYVSVNGVRSGNVRVTIGASSPGFLFFGENRAVVVNPDGSVNTATTPAKPGDTLVGFFVGMGIPDNPVPTGEAAPNSPLSIPTLPYKVFVGDFEARVPFLGLTPGYIGLGQVNFELPDLPPGDYPVTILIGEERSNGPVITVGAK